MVILITAAADSAAHRLARTLGSSEVIFADQQTLPVFSDKKFIQIPHPESVAFAHEILKVCLDYGVTKIYPMKKEELHELSKARQLFEEYGINVSVHPQE